MNAVVQARIAPAAPTAQRTIPFDYTLRFAFTGGTATIQQRLEISVEAPYVALGIGYGFVAESDPIDFGPPPPAPSPPPVLLIGAAPPPAPPPIDTLDVALKALERRLATAPRGELTLAGVLANGIRIQPRYLPQLLPKPGSKLGFAFSAFAGAAPADLFQTLAPSPRDLQFLFAMHDEGSGRAFQNAPVLSTAALGGADGRRPFRQFATPVRFEPRTLIRIEVTPLSTIRGELHFSLHGYKVLGTPGTPTDLARLARRDARRRVRR